MKKLKPSHKLLVFTGVVVFLLFIHHYIFRPIFLDWGAPRALQSMKFQGDTLTNGSSHTRAVLIHATPEDIWPWITQLGQDRGGFYSYQWLENVFRSDMRNVYVIKSEYQFPRQAGDTIWLANKNNYNGRGYQILAAVTAFKSFVMVGGDDYRRIQNGEKAWGAWAFYIYPEDANNTWLIVRSTQGNTHVGNRLLRYFFYEVPHFIMERKMLVTLKRTVEKNQDVLRTNEVVSDQ